MREHGQAETQTQILRKLVLTTHIMSSVGLLGAIASFLVLAIISLTGQQAPLVRGSYLAMELIAWYVIVPLAFASLLIGIVQSLGTSWGLFRHWWVLVKLLLTVFASTVLLLKLALFDYVARAAAHTALTRVYLYEARMELVGHAAAGLLVLLIPMVLSVYKPRGMTRYGWRNQQTRPD